MSRIGVLFVVLTLWRQAAAQNLEYLTCRGEGRIVCACDYEVSKEHGEDYLYPANVEKILVSVALTIEDCDEFVFDPYLVTVASSLKTLAIRNVTYLVLEALPIYIENLYLSNVGLIPYFNRELLMHLEFLDNLFLTNVVIDNFANDSFVDTLIYKAQFRNVTFANVTRDFFDNGIVATGSDPRNFVLKACDLYDVAKLRTFNFLNTNTCEYEFRSHSLTDSRSNGAVLYYNKTKLILLMGMFAAVFSR